MSNRPSKRAVDAVVALLWSWRWAKPLPEAKRDAHWSHEVAEAYGLARSILNLREVAAPAEEEPQPEATRTMRAIHKYSLALTDVQALGLPGDANPLTVQFQRGELCLWAVVDPAAPRVPWEVRVLGTGQLFPEAPLGQYVGTVQQENYVWHVYARRQDQP